MNNENYQVIARKFRPQSFADVKSQDAIVTTLRNAIRFNRIAHAYLFCGTRGTGKTTLARLFAKALNCENLSENTEPCNKCSSCREITNGNSLDVLEVDGASNRGIDDIRRINETASYAPSSGKFKVFIIDEVHMLTKEAFNALLKTLEEPPSHVTFIFATTEVHKVLPTILSRCQRFNLNRISFDSIVDKLNLIANKLEIKAEEDVLRYIAASADGGLRDAESLFDQIVACSSGEISYESVCNILGLVPKERFFELNKAGQKYDLAFAFDLANEIFTTGKDITHFMDTLIEHFRHLLLTKVSGIKGLQGHSEEEKQRYLETSKYYTEEQCLTIIEILIETSKTMKIASSQRVLLETALCSVIRVHHRIQVGELVQRLSDLEGRLQNTPTEELPPAELVKETAFQTKHSPHQSSVLLEKKKTTSSPVPAAVKTENVSNTTSIVDLDALEKQRLDTILQFAAVELEGTVKKTST